MGLTRVGEVVPNVSELAYSKVVCPLEKVLRSFTALLLIRVH